MITFGTAFYGVWVTSISVIVFLAAWELVTDGLHIFSSIILPSPVKVMKTFITKFTVKAPDGSTLIEHFWSSLKLTTAAFVFGGISGTLLGGLMGWYKPVNVMFRPLIDFIRPVPPIALIPVMIVTFGIGFRARAAVIFVAVFNNMVLNTYTYAGIRQAKDIHIWLAHTFGASNLQQLFTIAVPSAKPMFFIGLRLAMASAWMSALAAEMISSRNGLGWGITAGQENYVRGYPGKADKGFSC